MKSIEVLKAELIDKITQSEDAALLANVDGFFASVERGGVYRLSESQKQMIASSDADIAAGRVVPQAEIDAEDEGWMH